MATAWQFEVRGPLLALALLAAAPAAAQQASDVNPIPYADSSDPDVIRVGEDYYLVASSFHFSPAMCCRRRFTPAGGPFWLARFSGWKGSRPALFSFTHDERGRIDVDWAHVEVQPR